MPRVIGIDPGTVSIDLCGLDNGRLFLDRSWPTAEALADPARFVAELEAAGPLDLVVGPSGYGVPITRVQDITEEALRLAFLAAPGETGGIGGLRNLVRALARTALPVVLTPGVVHLPTVPAHRKVNRVDMGTAEKVCAVAFAVSDQARRLGSPLSNVSLVLLELGGAFTAAVAVAAGRIVDGVGGSAGPLGFRAAGALDGEVAYLAGEVPKALLFRGGAASIAGWDETTASPERLAHPTTPAEQVARDALVESTVKTAVALAAAVPSPKAFVLSGRLAHVEPLRNAIRERLEAFAPTRLLEGFAHTAKEGAQGAALIADGLAGGDERRSLRAFFRRMSEALEQARRCERLEPLADRVPQRLDVRESAREDECFRRGDRGGERHGRLHGAFDQRVAGDLLRGRRRMGKALGRGGRLVPTGDAGRAAPEQQRLGHLAREIGDLAVERPRGAKPERPGRAPHPVHDPARCDRHGGRERAAEFEQHE